MNRPITISLSPNVEADDVALAKQLLLRPTTRNDASPVQEATAAFEHLFLGQRAVLLTSGRAALYRLLTTLNIGPGDEVILQAFTCSVVPAAIQWAGATPIYADINPTDFNLDVSDVAHKITPRTRAIIIQHTFGIPANIAALQAVAKQHKLLLIEDCAHALGSQSDNNLLGTFGDAAFFSFGRDKILSSVFGGAIISKDNNLIEKIRAQTNTLPAAPYTWTAQQLLHPVALSGLLPHYFSHSIGKIALVALQRLRLISKVLTPAEKKGEQPAHLHYRYPAALAELLTHQLEKLPRFTERRQQIANRYQEAFKNNPRLTLPTPPANSRVAWLRYPVLVDKPSELRMMAKKQQILLGDWYDTPIGPRDVEPRTFGYIQSSCPVAEDITRHVINLPTYPLLTDQQVGHAITFIQNNA